MEHHSSSADSSLSQVFFQQFQRDVTALRQQLERLEKEKKELNEDQKAAMINDARAGLSRLFDSVNDASHNLPAYDQRTYAEVLKTLSDKLQDLRSNLAPKPKFSFKSGGGAKIKVTGEQSTHTSSFARISRSIEISTNSGSSSTPDSPTRDSNKQTIVKEGKHEYHFSDSNTVVVANRSNARIILPSTSPTSPTAAASSMPLASVTDIRRCVVDLSGHTASPGQAFASLSLKNIRDSLVICGHVDGAAHITDVKRSTLVVACRQFRLHDSTDVDVYLSCRTRPVIEYSTGLRFAPAAEIFKAKYPPSSPSTSESPSKPAQTQDQWNQIDDFNYLRPTSQGRGEEEAGQEEPRSPNWSILPPEKRLPVSVFVDLVRGEESNDDNEEEVEEKDEEMEGDEEHEEGKDVEGDGKEEQERRQRKNEEEARIVESILTRTVERLNSTSPL